ncbi:MAG: metallophosphoesterase, partial [Lentisphaeria bacterium]|nr:metallophosphoesterase [Lentisphaeria bacterium]
LAARAALPDSFEWFLGDRSFLLGSYDWPGSYPSWFFDGLIGDFSYRPLQEPYKGSPPKLALAPDILALRLLASPKPNYGVPVPAIVHGRVVLPADANAVPGTEGRGVANVSVSDGYSVAKTDKRGYYTLRPSSEAVFLFITRPSNHDVIGDWYKPLAAEVDFRLRRAKRSEEEYTFVLVTDTHVSSDPRSLAGLSQFVRDVNALDPPPRFVFNSGDLVNLDKQLKAPASRGHSFFRNYTGIMNHLRMPFYNVAGDHTDSGHRLEEFPLGDHRAGKPMYWEYLGPNLFSFEYGQLHFVSVDVVYHLGKKASHTMVAPHLAWFTQDLESRGTGAVVLTASENPLDRSIPGFGELATRCDIKLQLVGDTHVVSYRRNPVPSRAHGALAGTWWNGPCADLHPQGYMIYQVRGVELDCFYRGLGERVAIVSPAYGAGATGRFTVSADLLQPQTGEALQFSVGGGDWQAMKEVSRPFYRARFEGVWNTPSMLDGLVGLKVRCMPGGETRSHVVIVDNRRAKAPAKDGVVIFTAGRVIGAVHRFRGKVSVLLNGESIGSLAPGKRGECSFPVPENVLRKVNTLTFQFADPGDRISISSPVLHVGGKAIEDPRALAMHKVRANHWPEKIVRRAGFVLGDDTPESSFASRQDAFRFVLP